MELHSDGILSEGLVSVSQASKLLSLSRSTLYSLMERGELPYVKLGRARRVSRKALSELVARNAKGGWALEVAPASGKGPRG